jgi:hypothetical protein
MLCCVGWLPVQPTQQHQPRRTNVQPNQMELWCAEPHRTPRIYEQLNPEQRTRLILHLAFLMLKRVRHRTVPQTPPTSSRSHER